MTYIYHIHKHSLSTISLALLNLSMFTEHIHLYIHIDTYCIIIRRVIHVCIRIGTLRRAWSTFQNENTYNDSSNNYTANNHNGGYGTSS